MGWTTPRTWVSNEVVTAAIMNTHVRDNLNFLKGHHGVECYKTGGQAFAAGGLATITFDAESFDTDGYHDTVTNNGRLTVPSGLDGYYMAVAFIETSADTANHNRLDGIIRKNGATQLAVQYHITHTIQNGLVVAWRGPLVATDYLELRLNGVGNGALTIRGTSSDETRFGMYLVGS